MQIVHAKNADAGDFSPVSRYETLTQDQLDRYNDTYGVTAEDVAAIDGNEDPEGLEGKNGLPNISVSDPGRFENEEIPEPAATTGNEAPSTGIAGKDGIAVPYGGKPGFEPDPINEKQQAYLDETFGNKGQFTVHVHDSSFHNDGKFTAGLSIQTLDKENHTGTIGNDLGQDLADKLNSLAGDAPSIEETPSNEVSSENPLGNDGTPPMNDAPRNENTSTDFFDWFKENHGDVDGSGVVDRADVTQWLKGDVA